MVNEKNKSIDDFLSAYDDTVFSNALKLREIILKKLPGSTEQLDLPAKMIAYCYGQQYNDLICVIIPSKKGLKLGLTKALNYLIPTSCSMMEPL